MQPIEIIGLCAGGCLAISNIPQIIMIIRTKDTKSISVYMYLIYIIGVALWLTYGIIVNSLSMIISNAVAMSTAMFVFIFKLFNIIKYKEKP
ncbi:MAG: SemiSWEET transporter [Gammaproteobacteria bacterium]|nr:SemiSWEET transporter [Gammaproteobacteria bacterium]